MKKALSTGTPGIVSPGQESRGYKRPERHADALLGIHLSRIRPNMALKKQRPGLRCFACAN